MNMMRISLSCNSSDRENQFAALASHGIGQDLSQNADEGGAAARRLPPAAALFFADAESKLLKVGPNLRALWAFEP